MNLVFFCRISFHPPTGYSSHVDIPSWGGADPYSGYSGYHSGISFDHPEHHHFDDHHHYDDHHSFDDSSDAQFDTSNFDHHDSDQSGADFMSAGAASATPPPPTTTYKRKRDLSSNHAEV